MTASAPPPPSERGPAPSIAIPRSAARRLDVRVLDPAKAVRLDGDDALEPTLYAGNRLLVRGLGNRSAAGPIGALLAIAERLGYSTQARRDERLEAIVEQNQLGEQFDAAALTLVVFTALPDRAVAAPDAWEILVPCVPRTPSRRSPSA